jgi:16S rRNA (cytosine1402-N4)-methyltransferase
MSQMFSHEPVMLDTVVDLFRPVPAGVIVDATLGGGGHARAVLRAHPQSRLVGIDRDPAAIDAARDHLADLSERVTLRHARFDALAHVLDELGIGLVSGVLFDLGVSSAQLDQPERGFSYRADAPLDMRMDADDDRTAADVVNTYPQDELARLFRDSGETRFARRIAAAVVAARPVSTTAQLAEVVRNAIPAATRRSGGHPARRAFQALRIEVNHELEILPHAIDAAIDRLAPGGRIVVLAYHSGEDRIVKERLRSAATGDCVCPPGLPCVCGAQPTVRLLNRGARKPSADEIAQNRRAESARLRAAEKLPETSPPKPAGTD